MLSVDLLLRAYSSGAFPMAHPEDENEIYWHTPNIRGIIPLDNRFKVSKNLGRLYRSGKFEFKINGDFETVIRLCAEQRESTWISEEIIDAYCEMHRTGYAHSFEAWKDGELAGGLYRVTDASKLALIFLVEFLREQEFLLLDTQYLNPHIASFGAYEITHKEYLKLLRKALAK
jgi:leucyl/phenylalanyl-tRNA--protein transferase